MFLQHLAEFCVFFNSPLSLDTYVGSRFPYEIVVAAFVKSMTLPLEALPVAERERF